MDLKVVTDVERSARAGVAPERRFVPTDREAILLPLTGRERCAVAAMADALFRVGELAETPETLRIYQTLSAGFQSVTGVEWSEAPW